MNSLNVKRRQNMNEPANSMSNLAGKANRSTGRKTKAILNKPSGTNYNSGTKQTQKYTALQDLLERKIKMQRETQAKLQK